MYFICINFPKNNTWIICNDNLFRLIILSNIRIIIIILCNLWNLNCFVRNMYPNIINSHIYFSHLYIWHSFLSILRVYNTTNRKSILKSLDSTFLIARKYDLLGYSCLVKIYIIRYFYWHLNKLHSSLNVWVNSPYSKIMTLYDFSFFNITIQKYKSIYN